MTGSAVTAATFAAALGAGLMAGLFFAFSAAVMPALARIAPACGAAAMQSVNRAILNPVFFLAFFGTAALSLALAAAAFFAPYPGSGYALAGSLAYLAGCIGVTVARNVPLNVRLDAADPSSAEGARLWSVYLAVWTKWNHLRAVACLAASALFILALR